MVRRNFEVGQPATIQMIFCENHDLTWSAVNVAQVFGVQIYKSLSPIEVKTELIPFVEQVRKANLPGTFHVVFRGTVHGSLFLNMHIEIDEIISIDKYKYTPRIIIY